MCLLLYIGRSLPSPHNPSPVQILSSKSHSIQVYQVQKRILTKKFLARIQLHIKFIIKIKKLKFFKDSGLSTLISNFVSKATVFKEYFCWVNLKFLNFLQLSWMGGVLGHKQYLGSESKYWDDWGCDGNE